MPGQMRNCRSIQRRWCAKFVRGDPYGPFVEHEKRSTFDWGIPGDAEVQKNKFDSRLWRVQNEEYRAGEEDDLWELLFPVDAGQLRKVVRVRPYWMNSYARWVHKTHEYATYVPLFMLLRLYFIIYNKCTKQSPSL